MEIILLPRLWEQKKFWNRDNKNGEYIFSVQLLKLKRPLYPQ